jgi:ABC-type glycerol-3-phosphate transport system substrate-binding protein
MQQNCRASAALFFLLLALALAASGCSSARTTGPDLPFRGVTLTVACPPSCEPFLKRAARGWQARHQANSVTFVPFDPAQPPGADIWIVPGWQLPRWVVAGKVQPLPESLIQRDGASSWPAVLPLYRESLVVWLAQDRSARVPWAVPVLGEGPVLCYRSDLYADPAQQTAYRTETGQVLHPPATWAEFEIQAGYFSRKAQLSLPALPTDPGALERLFGQVAAGYARRPAHDVILRTEALPESALVLFQNLDTGAPLLDQPAFVHALQLLQKLQAFRAPARATGQHEPDEPEELFRAGKAALCLCEAPWIVRFQEKDSSVRDNFNVTVLPGAEKFIGPEGTEDYLTPNRMPYLGTGLLVGALPTDLPGNKDAAVSLLAHLLERETNNSLVLSPPLAGRVVRSDQLDERIRWDVLGLDQARTRATVETLRETLLLRNLRNPALALRCPDAEAHRDLLVAQLRRALLDKVDAKTCLQEASQGWQQRREKLGAATIRSGARLSVGLLP